MLCLKPFKETGQEGRLEGDEVLPLD